MSNANAWLRAESVSKYFGGVPALRDVSLDLRAGEIHALVGENGAGKSTLIKALGGVQAPDTGRILLGSQVLAPGVAASEAAGIAVIYQESTAFEDLSAVDNIFVGREIRRGPLLDRARMKVEAQRLLRGLGESFSPDVPLSELSLAQRQMVAFARALSRRSKLLVLDEPTASLSQRESSALFEILRRLQGEGVAILYVSHRLDEVFALADRVSVLRDGAHVATHAIAEVDKDALIRLMVGREVSEFRAPASTCGGAEVLRVENLSRAGAFRDVSLSVRAGEIVGLAGLVGAGRSEVARAIFGVDRADSGRVLIDGVELKPGDVSGAIARGVALVPEDRGHEGLVLEMSVGENLSLASLGSLARGWNRNRRAESELVERLMREMSVRAASTELGARSLSGGNQQKLALGKWLAREPKLLILDEPTRGVDVGARAQIYELIRQAAARGMATLVISSDLPEVLGLCERIVVMSQGEVAGEVTGAEATPERVLELALPREEAVRPLR